jgi:hypothetical protein
MNNVPYFEPDPLEPFALDDSQVEALLAARRRRMGPPDYLSTLVERDWCGVEPFWMAPDHPEELFK